MLSRNERINQKKKEQLINSFITTNKRLKRSVAVLSTSFFMTTVVKPVQLVLAAESTTLRTTDTQVYSTNPFLNQIIPSATVIAAQNDLYASVMMAQAILESGWGTSTLSKAPNYNLFGIKGEYNGESINMETLEDSGGQNYYPINAEFRKYPSYAESLQDYAALLANGTSWNPTYYAGAWKSNAATYQDATAYLTGRYATDTAYSTKLNRIIAQYGLDQYDNYQPVVEEEVEEPDAGDIDFETPAETPELPTVELPENTDEDTAEQETPAEPTENTEEAETPTTPETPVQAGDAVHVVQSGDTLYAVAKKYGISLVDLLTLNKLNSNMIYVGDRLVLPDNGTASVTPGVTTPTTTPSTGSSVVVVSGDTLWKIATANGLTVSELKTLNNLTSDAIMTGQTLLLKSAATVTPTTPTTPTVTPGTTTGNVTVASGDTLWKIANANGLSVAELKALNKLTSDVIVPGQTLLLKQTTTTPSVTQPTTPATPTTPSTASTIKVASGDTLWKIANANGLSVTALKALNSLTSDVIVPGQVLTLKSTTVTAPTVTQPTTTAPTTSTTTSTITVATGDTLWKIANANGLAVTELKALNNLSSDYIYPGQSLKVKAAVTTGNTSTVVTTPAVTTPSVPTATNKVYTVQKGDTLYKIASANGVSVADLKTWNSLSTDIIFVSQSLKVAATTTSAQATAPTTSAPAASANSYTVVKGDTLYSIAKKNGVSLAALIEANDITSNVIYVGQVITF